MENPKNQRILVEEGGECMRVEAHIMHPLFSGHLQLCAYLFHLYSLKPSLVDLLSPFLYTLGVLPMLKLVHEDKNSVLTRLSLAVLREAVEAVDVMDKRSVALTAQTMMAYLRKNINRAFHRWGRACVKMRLRSCLMP
jgi:hypothetical protein